MMVSECERKTRLGENDLKEDSARGEKLNCCDSKVLTQFEHIMIIINAAAAIFSATKKLKV